jgi:hypothetical protein
MASVMASSTAPAARDQSGPSRRRHAIAASLLAASFIVPLINLLFPMMKVPLSGFGESYWLWVLAALQFAVTPVGNVVSLVLADRRKLWVKLNYLVLAVWLLVGVAILGLPWLLAHH